VRDRLERRVRAVSGREAEGGGGGRGVEDETGMGLHSFTYQLNLSRVLHTKRPYTPPNTPLTRATQPLRAPPIPQKALKLSRKVDECKPLAGGGRQQHAGVGCDDRGVRVLDVHAGGARAGLRLHVPRWGQPAPPGRAWQMLFLATS